MTDLAELEPFVGGGDEYEKLPPFTFKRIDRTVKNKEVLGDGVTGRILRSAMVDVTRDNRTVKKLVIDLELTEESRGGIVERDHDDDGNEVTKFTNFSAGDSVVVWVGPGPGIEAIRDAVAAAGATSIEDGATLSYRLSGHKPTGKTYPLNLFEASYTPAVRSTSLDELE